MKNILIKSSDKVELSSKTVVAAHQSATPQNSQERKPRADPFFEVKSPRATEGDRVTVTFARC